MRTRLLARLAVLVAVALALVAAVATAARRPPVALAVASASVAQSGPQLAWTVQMRSPFSPAALRRSGRTLCLLVGRGASAGTLCVIGPARGARAPRLTYRALKGTGTAQATVIAATISRSSDRELSASFDAAAVGVAYTTLRWQVQSTLRGHGCTPVNASGTPCVALFPARSRLLHLHTPQLAGCTATGPPFVYSGTTQGKEIALTFDDGPWYDTPQFLALLEREKVPATFFQIGDQISEYGGADGAIERRMLADGDMIGDHTWTHPDVAGAGTFARTQIEQTAAAIRAATGFTPCLFRAPYGDTSPALISEVRSLGFTTIQWDIDPRDWALPGVGEIETNVLANARPGGIVEMHDGGGNRSETLAALPTIIATLRARGYTFVTVTQLLGQSLIYR